MRHRRGLFNYTLPPPVSHRGHGVWYRRPSYDTSASILWADGRRAFHTQSLRSRSRRWSSLFQVLASGQAHRSRWVQQVFFHSPREAR